MSDKARRVGKASLLASTGMYGLKGGQAQGSFGSTSQTRHFGAQPQIELDGPALKAGERGLIISPLLDIDENTNRVQINGGPDPEELRAGLLFWDRIEWPTNNLFHLGHPTPYEFLIAEGVMTRSRANFAGGGEMARAMVDAHRTTFSALDIRDQGRWTSSRRSDSPTIVGDKAAEQRGLMMRLFKAIPLPDGEAPFEEILNFRAKRRAELQALRASVDQAFLDILGAPDRAFAETAAIDRIDAAVRDLLACSKENRFRQFLSNIDLSFDWRAAGEAGFRGMQQGLSLADAAVGAVGAGIAISSSFGSLRPKKNGTASPYEYAASIHRELRWTE